MMSRFWSSLLLLMLIPIALLPNESNATSGNEDEEMIDKNAIEEVMKIFNKMPEGLKQNREPFLNDAKTAQCAFDRFMAIFMKYEPSISGNELYMIAKTIFDNKELVLSPKVLNIFNFKAEEAAKDDTGNYVVNLVKSKIQSVQNAVNFYEPGKDSDINDQNYKGLEKEMTKLKMQMQKFELWLKKVWNNIVEPNKKWENKVAVEFLKALSKNDNENPFVAAFYAKNNQSSNIEKNGIVEEEHHNGSEHHSENNKPPLESVMPTKHVEIKKEKGHNHSIFSHKG